MKNSKLYIQCLLATFLIGMATSSAQAETLVGRWCDRPLASLPDLDGILEIAITDSGTIELRASYGDGSSSVTELDEEGSGLYRAIGNRFGEKYRIVPADGKLQLLDNDGLIRTATRLYDEAKPGECGKAVSAF